MTPRLRFVLFDLDGTLVDSSPLHDRAFRIALAAHRPSLLPGFQYESVRGLTTEEAFVRLGERDPSVRAALVTAKREAFAALGPARAFRGALPLLIDLSRRGIGAYIVTSASRRSALTALRATGLALHVRGLIAAEDVRNGKPAPDPYLAALRRFGLCACDGMVVEDAHAGLVSAAGAGLDAVRVHGRYEPNEPVVWYPDLIELHHALRASPLRGRNEHANVRAWHRISSR